MAKGYVFRGQGLGVITDKVFLQWPSKADFDEVMRRELSLHGFQIDGDAVTVIKRWVRVQEVELVGVDLPAGAETCPGELNELVYGELDEASLREILTAPREPTGTATLIEMSGTGTVINPGEPGYNPNL
jgi:hypothetical protein